MLARPARLRLTVIVGAALAVALLASGCAAQTDPPARSSEPPTRSVVVAGKAAPAAPAAVERTTTSTPAAPKPNACAHNTSAQLVRVSLHAQHLWMCARTHLVYSTPITSGIVGQYTSTPTGTYTIQGLNRNTVLTINTGAQYDVKYWIPFDAPLFGFHDSSWQKFPYGSPQYKTDGSHGCVHMPLKAIKFLYHWTQIGATVKIRA